ncbi:MAG: hypothetical protein ACXVCP_13980 [Bdellovibrio sp.]
MANSFVKSLSVLIALTSAVPVYALPVRAPQGDSAVVQLYGLNQINIDDWTKLLANARSEGVSVLQVRDLMLKVIASARNNREIYIRLKNIMASTRIASADDYRDLAVMLLELRQELRQQKVMSMADRRDSLYMMEILAEESLVVGSQKFADFPKEINIQGQAKASSNVADLRDFKVQTGDVTLSKATGSGSSSFIALTMQHPHVFSHSTPVFISAQGDLLSPESEIETGVELRPMKTDYVDGSKTRMYIYRYQGSEPGVQQKVEVAMQKFVDEMYARTGGDPFNKPSFKYDFSMTPGDAYGRGLFCSAVGCEVYSRAGLNDDANPYPQDVWSSITDGRKDLLNMLSLNAKKVPAPGDVELNSDFLLVGARIDVTRLVQDRIEMAIIDVFLSELSRNKDLLKQVSDSLSAIASKPVDKESLKKLASSGLLPAQVAQKINLIDKIPDSINAKQLVFFGFLNEVLTPKLRDVLMPQIAALQAQGQIVGPMEIRRMARKQGLAIFSSQINVLQSKVTALSGVGSCLKLFN